MFSVQALIIRGVIGDYREPGPIRFGLASRYPGCRDVWRAVQHCRAVPASGGDRYFEPGARASVA